ncbi:MAG: hypothetical protein RIE73_19030 [Coleofasciculus sp. C1-SOL-03]|uniref:hypothetical protein n=1 Tax=Coleofasciculus sp. C1-SOL-03 TaxID=3069522 RepID=UPI0032FF1F07
MEACIEHPEIPPNPPSKGGLTIPTPDNKQSIIVFLLYDKSEAFFGLSYGTKSEASDGFPRATKAKHPLVSPMEQKAKHPLVSPMEQKAKHPLVSPF